MPSPSQSPRPKVKSAKKESVSAAAAIHKEHSYHEGLGEDPMPFLDENPDVFSGDKIFKADDYQDDDPSPYPKTTTF